MDFKNYRKPPKLFKDFSIDQIGSKEVIAMAEGFVTNKEFYDQGIPCLIMGLPGAGKTAVASAIFNRVNFSQFYNLYLYADDLERLVKRDYDSEVHDEFDADDVVVVDGLNEPSKEIVHMLCKRYDNCRVSIVTTSLPSEEDITKAFGASFARRFLKGLVINLNKISIEMR